MHEKILVAFDGSKQAERAFAEALEIATRFRSELIVVSVIQLPEPATRVEVDAALDDTKAHFEKDFEALRRLAAASNVTLRTETEIGHPAEKILSRAEAEGVDLIVCGRRGRSVFDRWLIGSVSTRLVRYARCSVLVVH
jgi:nucleotide-binding universal stress UspA family protein